MSLSMDGVVKEGLELIKRSTRPEIESEPWIGGIRAGVFESGTALTLCSNFNPFIGSTSFYA